MKLRHFLILSGMGILCMLIFLSFIPQKNSLQPAFENIIRKLEEFIKGQTQQKIYLHFDKVQYNADEIVWFKAYLLNASRHTPDSNTTNLYVELVNPSGYIVQNKLIRMTNGFGNGDFSFLDTVPEGNYKIRAFTNWMKNTDPDFYFESGFYISNPEFSRYITKEEIKQIKKERRETNKLLESYDIQFLPEGGRLLTGIENRVGFKAINELGQGIPVSGEIKDKKGNTVTTFQSNPLGLGSVRFIPQNDQEYLAYVKTPDNRIYKIKLPEPVTMGINISAEKLQTNRVKVKINTVFPDGQLPPNTLYFLLVHSRGQVLQTQEFDIKNPVNELIFSTADFPTGIIHITLFNLFAQSVSERLMFVNNNDRLTASVETSSKVFTSREKVPFQIRVLDKKGNPVQGNFSLSVANYENIRMDQDIFSSLYLNSDLKSRVENPGYYFKDPDPLKEQELDDLMLTQGWRRFSWSNVLSETRLPPKFENEKGITVTGKITKEFFGIPLRDILVTMNIENEFNDIFTTRSGEKGKFRFENIDYQDTVSISIEAYRASGRRNLVIYLDSKQDPRDKDMQYYTRQNLTRKGENAIYHEPPDPDADDPFAEQNNRIYRLHEEPSASNVIIIDETNQNYNTVGQILEGRVPGVMITGNKVNIRGISSMYMNTDPLFLVDGMPVDAEYALNMSLYDVQRIEVLKGPETAIYGSRGGNGVIAIYTKRGKFMKKGILEFKMLGYYTPREYYKPRYEYRQDDPFEDDRRTILWEPFITTDENGEYSSYFYTSDIKGRYFLRMEGISNNGTPGSAEMEIEVK